MRGGNFRSRNGSGCPGRRTSGSRAGVMLSLAGGIRSCARGYSALHAGPACPAPGHVAVLPERVTLRSRAGRPRGKVTLPSRQGRLSLGPREGRRAQRQDVPSVGRFALASGKLFPRAGVSAEVSGRISPQKCFGNDTSRAVIATYAVQEIFEFFGGWEPRLPTPSGILVHVNPVHPTGPRRIQMSANRSGKEVIL